MQLLLGSLSNDDNNSSKKVAQKVDLGCFKLHRYYSHSFILSNVGNFFQELISKGMYLSSQNCFPVFVSSLKHEIRKFYIRVMQ